MPPRLAPLRTSVPIGLTGRDPTWYKDAVIYELHVRAFCDSTADGNGDFPGLTSKLDYLQDLGVTALWLLPFYPSPLRDDGYDIADYADVHPTYGTLRDFKAFLREAHNRGLRVITELVLNHTSDQHPWFQRARRSPSGSAHRDFYVWSDTPEKYKDARIIFKDFEASNWSWDPVAKAYYWHRFYSHQPDLNFDSPHVRKAMVQTLDFWLDMGVDGLRLDAVPYLYEREGTTCENLAETHAFLKELRRHVDEKYGDRLLLAEANQWPEDAAAYFGAGKGDESHAAFHFPVMPRLFMASRTEDRFPIVDILEQTPAVPETAQWFLFLRNHDELTLEMVTDEERDYMYRFYAQDPRSRINLGIRRRLAPLLHNDRRRIELMNVLLFSLPGTPVLYYGDEIGMGDNIYLGDRNSVRTPMQWSADRNAGFSRANPQQMFLPINIDPESHYEAVNVDVQLRNPSSLLWWMRQLIALRRRTRAFGRGTLQFLKPENRKVIAFTRSYQDEQILVVANLSRHSQHAELDLSAYEGQQPIELSSRNPFPPITKNPYVVALGPHGYFWFMLKPPGVAAQPLAGELPEVELPGPTLPRVWSTAFVNGVGDQLEDALPNFLRARRWFRGKSRRVRSTNLVDLVPMDSSAMGAQLALVKVEYVDGEPETYALPMALAPRERVEKLKSESRAACIALVQPVSGDGPRLLYDAVVEPEVGRRLVDDIAHRRQHRGRTGQTVSWLTTAGRKAQADLVQAPDPRVLKSEQSNTSIAFGDRFILKLFRVLEEGKNPEDEIGRFLTERTNFTHSPAVLGGIEYRPNEGQPTTVALLHQYIPHEGDAWRYTLDHLGRFFERVLVRAHQNKEIPAVAGSLVELSEREPIPLILEMMGTYGHSARLIGTRTAELHRALASQADDPEFAPEQLSALYLRSVHQAMRSQARQAFETLRTRLSSLDEATRQLAEKLLRAEARILDRFRGLLSRKLEGARIRIHGDYHLGQVLFTGKDFYIIDFEGEPARALGERRIKRSPLRDVAGMIRSFQYAAHYAMIQHASSGIAEREAASVAAWTRCWTSYTSAAFLRAYREGMAGSGLIPSKKDDLDILLQIFLFDKAIYELSYELNNRPDWVRVPIQGILDLLEAEP